jgi:aminomethyltransferase
VPADILNLKAGRQRYTQLLNSSGGIIDDLLVVRPRNQKGSGSLNIVVNASRKECDYQHIRAALPSNVRLHRKDDFALFAIQGPAAEDVVCRRLLPQAAAMSFMQTIDVEIQGTLSDISRSGYTGEDGFEISVSRSHAADIWSAIVSDPLVLPIGLAARDSLRLEGGLSLWKRH